MIIVKNRELLIPGPERYIGTTYDTESENRQFLLSRFAQNGVDLSALTFRLDLKYANDATDTVVLDKEVTDTNIILTWNIGSSVLQVPGTLFIQLRAVDDEVTVKWSSFSAAMYAERHLNTPGNYGGSLTEIEQIEQDHQYMKGVVDELKSHLDYTHEAEAWAIGKKDGEDVPSTDETYHNNSKYYSDQASTKATQAANSATAAANSATQAAETVSDTNARFNNAVSAVTSETEVIDARVGADGTTYPVLKTRLDTEHAQLKNAITPLYDLFTVPVTFVNLVKASMWTVGQAVKADDGYTDTNKPAYIRTAWISFNFPTLIWIDSQTYKFIVWGYSASSNTAGTYSPQKVYAQNPVIIAPIQGTVSFRLGVTRVDSATMTNTDVTNVISALRTYQLPGIRSGMKIACFGDSIMWGRDGNGSPSTQVDETIPKIMSKALGCQCDNYGIGVQGYLPHTGVVSAYDTISAVNLTEYDAMVMCFGVNDGYNDLGGWDSTDESTIMGQFNKIVNYVFAQNPKIRLIVIAPWNGKNIGTAPDYWYGPRSHQLGYVSRRILSDTLKTACDYYWIPYIEQYDSPINPLNITTALPDGVHPSADFYKLLGEWLAAKVATII